MAAKLLKGLTIEDSYAQAIVSSSQHCRTPIFSQEISHFKRLFAGTIGNLAEDKIASDGYVIHTLEASIWCLFNSNSFQDAVLKAVNLGGDTDTTGCVTGGLAGVYYGFEAIPKNWLSAIVREKDIGDVLAQFTSKVQRA
jgi:ADP-ribosyl-[dinitrogen reductase] hydrolase